MSVGGESHRVTGFSGRFLVALCKPAGVLVVCLAVLGSQPVAWGLAGEEGAPPSVKPRERGQDQERKNPGGKSDEARAAEAEKKARAAEAKRKARADSLAALLARLGVGEGAAVADVGAGNG